MISSAKYVHTNLIAKDWRKLADFYIKVFGCIPILPERNFSGETLEKGTSIKGSTLTGVHLKLPGFKIDAPTLEIFSYSLMEEKLKTAVNRPGFGHIAFAVDNIEKAREEVINNGGSKVGEIVTLELSNKTKVIWVYVTDPEGNILELQKYIK